MRRTKSLSAFLLLAALPLVLSAQAVALPGVATVRRTLDSLATDFANPTTVPATAIAVVRGSDTLLFRAYGKANLELGTPATVTTVFRIGSVTKQFTSSAVLQMIEEGKLALTDTIGRWLPELPVSWRGVTIQQLLNHTSGIPSYTELGEPWQKRWGEEMTGAQLVALTADKPFAFSAGTSWKYNNTGYVLLGMLVEARAGKPWGEEYATRFFRPLGLTNTHYCATQALIPGRAEGYSQDSTKAWINTPFLAMSQPHGAGAMCSTIGDLLAWNRALHGGKVLKPASYAAMTTPIGAAVAHHYGFGIGTGIVGTHAMLTHGGGINGFLTANLWVPDAKLSVTVLTNGDAVDPGRVALQLARAALGVPLELPPKAVAMTPTQLRTYSGVYDLALGGAPKPFTVSEKDGVLYGQLEGQGPSVMIPLGNHTFGASFDPALRIVFTLVDGKSVTMQLTQGGGQFEGKRRPQSLSPLRMREHNTGFFDVNLTPDTEPKP